MRESEFTKPKYTLVINGKAKITKKNFFELNQLAKEYKEKHPQDDVKVVPNKELDEANIKGMFRKGMKNIKRALTPGIKGKLANKGDALLMKGIKASNIATTDKQLKQADRMVHHSGRLRKLGKGLNPFAPYPEEPRKYPEVIKPGETRDVVIPIPSRNRAVRVRIERQDTYRYAYFTYRDEEGNEQGDEFDVYAFPSLQSVFDKKILPEIYYYDTGDSAKFVNGKIVHSDPRADNDDDDLDEGEVIQGPWKKKEPPEEKETKIQAATSKDPFVIEYNKWVANGALTHPRIKKGRIAEKLALEIEKSFNDPVVGRLAKCYYWVKRIVDEYKNDQAWLMTERKFRSLDSPTKVTETSSTGQGGGSAGIGGGSMVGGPRTYEEEFGPFKKKGKFKRTIAMTY
jgi:hypothetical protein